MPKYIIFLIIADRPAAEKEKDHDDLHDHPSFQKMMKEFLNWVKAEIEAERIKGANYLLDSSEDTHIRIGYHTPWTPEEDKVKTEGESISPPSKSSITRGQQAGMSKNMLAYYTAEFPKLDDVITWGRSCPIAYDGFSLEIRELDDNAAAVGKMPPKEKEWVGDKILAVRRQMLEEGKMKKEGDGTQWVKLEDSKEIKEIVVAAEERDAQKEED